MNQEKPVFTLSTQPGIQRDGTTLDQNFYQDGQWVRFQRGRPKKIGGYKEISPDIDNIPRGVFVFSKNNNNYVYVFTKDNVSVLQVDNNGVGNSIFNITPTALVSNDLHNWQTSAVYDATGSGTSVLLAHAATNLSDIANETNTNIYTATVGETGATMAKMADGAGGYITVSGGVCVLQPYTFVYGNNGLIKNSTANDPNNFVVTPGNSANAVNVSATKVVKGVPIRGGGNSPTGLFWALDSVIRVSYIGGTSVFKYDPLSVDSSVLSSSGFVEYDNIYYWPGTDRFLMCDGSKVTEVPNQMNLNWFFDNLNYSQRQKVFGMKVTRYGEIWWFYPRGTATECTDAIILNIREKTWYDTGLARGCGISAQTFKYPVMTGNTPNYKGKYSVFAHEAGVNAVEGGKELALYSMFESSDFGLPTGGAGQESPQGINRWTRLTRVEPDFIQSGDMTMTVIGEEFAQTPTVSSTPYTFSPTTGKIDTREQKRNIRVRFESNVVGGNYEMGKVILHTETGDNRS